MRYGGRRHHCRGRGAWCVGDRASNKIRALRCASRTDALHCYLTPHVVAVLRATTTESHLKRVGPPPHAAHSVWQATPLRFLRHLRPHGFFDPRGGHCRSTPSSTKADPNATLVAT